MKGHLILDSSIILKWNLDSPKADNLFDHAEEGRFKIRGWALGVSGKTLHLAVRQNGVTRCYPFNKKRADVITKVLEAEPTGHPQLMCGFDYTLPSGAPVQFGFECNAQLVWLKVLNPEAG